MKSNNPTNVSHKMLNIEYKFNFRMPLKFVLLLLDSITKILSNQHSVHHYKYAFLKSLKNKYKI